MNSNLTPLQAPPYQEALKKSGYNYELKFDPSASTPKTKKKNRKRNILWFNPPWNSEVKTNVGKEFLKIVDECFPPENPLSKIFNRKSVKISYSTTPNMEQIITGKNTRVLNNQTEDPNLKRCNCTKEECPLDGKCQERSLVYIKQQCKGRTPMSKPI